MSELARQEKRSSELDLSELVRLLASFSEIEMEDVTIRASKIVIRPLRGR